MISVIVPVYNCETYIKKCVESILAQSYKDFELLLVDDGSKDASGEICDALAKNDDRVKVIHKANEGAGKARNDGINAAKGEFIAFVDADDFVSPFYLQTLFDALQENNADIAMCEYERVYDEEICWQKPQPKNIEIFDEKNKFDVYLNPKYGVGPICKLVKTQIVKNNLFSNHKVGEDARTTPKWLFEAKKVVFVSTNLYAYYFNPKSITNTDNYELYFGHLEARAEIIDYFTQISQNKIIAYQHKLLLFLLFLSLSQNERKFSDKEYKKSYKNALKTAKNIIYNSIYIDKINKILLKIAASNHLLARLVFRIYKLIGASQVPKKIIKKIFKMN